MTALSAFLWIANVVLNTVGQMAFKAVAMTKDANELRRWGAMFRSPMLWVGVFCFCLEFASWFGLLSLIPLSQAMLIASLNIVAVTIAGKVLFGDKLDLPRVAGMSLIAVGVALAGGAH